MKQLFLLFAVLLLIASVSAFNLDDINSAPPPPPEFGDSTSSSIVSTTTITTTSTNIAITGGSQYDSNAEVIVEEAPFKTVLIIINIILLITLICLVIWFLQLKYKYQRWIIEVVKSFITYALNKGKQVEFIDKILSQNGYPRKYVDEAKHERALV